MYLYTFRVVETGWEAMRRNYGEKSLQWACNSKCKVLIDEQIGEKDG